MGPSPITPAKRSASDPLSNSATATESVKRRPKQVASRDYSCSAAASCSGTQDELGADASSSSPRNAGVIKSHRSSKSCTNLGNEDQPPSPRPALLEVTTSISVSTNRKGEIKSEQQLQCWLCQREHTAIHVADQFPQSMLPKFKEYYAMGLVPPEMKSLEHEANLISLCLQCHGAYNKPIPDWVMIPENIDFFIEWEKRDYEERKSLVNAPRSVPGVGSTDYKGNFHVYFNTKDSIVELVGGCVINLSEPYVGSPIAAILKASCGIGHSDIGIMTTVEISDRCFNRRKIKSGIPHKVLDKLTELRRLWVRPHPLKDEPEAAKNVVEPESPDIEKNAPAETLIRRRTRSMSTRSNYQTAEATANAQPEVTSTQIAALSANDKGKHKTESGSPPLTYLESYRNRLPRILNWGSDSTSNDKIAAATCKKTVSMIVIKGKMEEKDGPPEPESVFDGEDRVDETLRNEDQRDAENEEDAPSDYTARLKV